MKSEKLIMVVPRKILFENRYFEGFMPVNGEDYESRILGNFEYMKRGLAETDAEYKQPICYSVIFNPKTRKIFAYQRASHDEKYKEKRLQGKWSWGVGGHIEKFDANNANPLHASMLRELEEEVDLKGAAKPVVLGYINYDKDEVGKVHFGILYLIETDSESAMPKDSEIESGGWKTIEELEEICLNPSFSVEDWSRISLEQLKRYLN